MRGSGTVRFPALVLLVCCPSPAPSADPPKSEDLAKEVALSLVKAVKARDLDAVMMVVDVPFVVRPAGGEGRVIKDRGELEKYLKARLAESNPDRVPSVVHRVEAWEKVRKATGDVPLTKQLDEVAGKGAQVVVFELDGKPGGRSLVRIDGEKAKVVFVSE